MCYAYCMHAMIISSARSGFPSLGRLLGSSQFRLPEPNYTAITVYVYVFYLSPFKQLARGVYGMHGVTRCFGDRGGILFFLFLGLRAFANGPKVDSLVSETESLLSYRFVRTVLVRVQSGCLNDCKLHPVAP